MEINLPYKVDMSVNEMYWYPTNHVKKLKPEALKIRAKIMADVKSHIELQKKEYRGIQGEELSIGIRFKEDWYYKNGNAAKKDLDNRLKFLIDSIFKGLDIDDKMVFEIWTEKVQWKNDDRVEIIIMPKKEVHDEEWSWEETIGKE